MSSVEYLRGFVSERLTAAAEEIFNVFIKTIVEYEEEINRQRKLLDLAWKPEIKLHRIDEELSLTCSTVEHGGDAPGPSTPEESNFSLSTEVPGPSQTSTDVENNNWTYCSGEADFRMSEIKEEPEELGVDGQTQAVVKSEQDQPELSHTSSYEMQPVSQSRDDDGDGLKGSKGEQTEMMQQKGKMLQGQSGSIDEEPSLTGSTVEHGGERDAPGPSTPEESNFNLSTEVPGPSQTSTDVENNNWTYCSGEADFGMSEVKEVPEELGGEGQTQEMLCPSPEIVKSEDQPASYEMQPVSSDCPAAQNDNDDDEDQGKESKGEQTEMTQQKGKMLQGQSGRIGKKRQAASPYDKCPAKHEKVCSFCHLCGKGFQYNGSLMKHIKTHENKIDGTVCGMTYQSTEEPKQADIKMSEMKDEQEELGGDGQTQAVVKSKQDQPESSHTSSYEMQPVSQSRDDDGDGLKGSKGEQTEMMQQKRKMLQGQSGSINKKRQAASPYDKCSAKHEMGRSFLQIDSPACGMTYRSPEELISHLKECRNKTHFCDVCGKTFANIRCLQLHERTHTGIREFMCQECDVSFNRRANLIVHMRTHSGEKPYPCDTCDKRFRYNTDLVRHKSTHTATPSPGEELQLGSRGPRASTDLRGAGGTLHQ